MTINERQGRILELALNAYLRENEPITSQRLFDEGDFGLSSAALRYELARLDDLGYLYQPHISGGRYPTNLALEWFIDEFVLEELDPEYFSSALECAFSVHDRNQKLFYHFANFAADACDSFCNIYIDNVSYQAGLDDLFACLDTFSPETVRGIIEDVEYLDERLQSFSSSQPRDKNFLRVFFGKESPITKSEDLAVMIAEMYNADFNGVAVLIGSKRMPYKRNMSFLEASRRFFNTININHKP